MGRDGFDSSAIKRALKEKPSAYAEMKNDYDFSKAVKNPYAARFHHLVESRGKSRLTLRFNNPRKQEMPQPKNTVIFINYRRTDTGWRAEHLKDKLGAAFGKDRVFLDVRDIDAGDDFNSEIESQLQRAAALIVLIDKNWLLGQDKFGRRRLDNEDDWVRKEIRTALKNNACKVLPLLLDGAGLPDQDALPDDISELVKRQKIEVRAASREADINALIKQLENIDFQILARAAPSLPNPDVRVKTNLRLVSAAEGVFRKHLSIKVENHSPLSLFMGNVELRLKDGQLLYVPRDSVTGEPQQRRKLDPAESFSFNIALGAIASKVNPRDLACASVKDDIDRVYESDESMFQFVVDALFDYKS